MTCLAPLLVGDWSPVMWGMSMVISPAIRFCNSACSSGWSLQYFRSTSCHSTNSVLPRLRTGAKNSYTSCGTWNLTSGSSEYRSLSALVSSSPNGVPCAFLLLATLVSMPMTVSILIKVGLPSVVVAFANALSMPPTSSEPFSTSRTRQPLALTF